MWLSWKGCSEHEGLRGVFSPRRRSFHALCSSSVATARTRSRGHSRVLGGKAALARSPHRTAGSRCSCLRSPSESPRDRCWKFDRNEQARRVNVVLAGLVDDPNVAFSIGFAVWQYLIDLSDLQVLHAAVFHAQRERASRLLNSHDLSPRNALSLVLACQRREPRTSGFLLGESIRSLTER